MAVENVDIMVLDQIMAEADRSVTLGDALDIKGNIWLVVITFLATQTAYFLTTGITQLEHCGQILSAVLLVFAGALTLIELRPQTYILFQPSNGALSRRLEQLREFYSGEINSEQLILAEFIKSQIKWATERAIKNQAINERKSQLISWAFWVTSVAATINFMTLLHFLKVWIF